MKKMLMLAAAFISLTLQAVDLVESFADGKYLPKTWGPVRAMNFTDSETGNFKSAIVLEIVPLPFGDSALTALCRIALARAAGGGHNKAVGVIEP